MTTETELKPCPIQGCGAAGEYLDRTKGLVSCSSELCAMHDGPVSEEAWQALPRVSGELAEVVVGMRKRAEAMRNPTVRSLASNSIAGLLDQYADSIEAIAAPEAAPLPDVPPADPASVQAGRDQGRRNVEQMTRQRGKPAATPPVGIPSEIAAAIRAEADSLLSKTAEPWSAAERDANAVAMARRLHHIAVRADAIPAYLSARLAALGPVERQLMERLLGRLELGRKRYGAMDLADGRDWRAEAQEELLDGCVYMAAALEQQQAEQPATIERLCTVPRLLRCEHIRVDSMCALPLGAPCPKPEGDA